MPLRKIEKIQVGDVVKSDFGGWWRITHRTMKKDSVWMDAVNVDTDRPGFIAGMIGDKRTVR